MLRKARAGHVTGCKVFGYDNIEIFVGETNKDGERTRSHVVRRINPEEAKVICRIFETYGAGGIGIARLATSVRVGPLKRCLQNYKRSRRKRRY